MIRKALLAAVLAAALPLVAGSSNAVPCQTWNANSVDSHHRVGAVDVVGGRGYGSGFHDAAHKSPPQPLGAYGDPQRRGAEGGYVQVVTPKLIVNVNLFGPFDETDNAHLYDTVFGACVSYKNTGVNTGEKCVGTSKKGGRTPPNWTPCGGY